MMMTSIKWNTIGLVKSGDMKGYYVKAYPDNDGTGGYYLLFSKDFSNTQAEGYDEWYPNLDELSNRFSDFNIDWQNWIQG